MVYTHKKFVYIFLVGCLLIASGCSHRDNTQPQSEPSTSNTEQSSAVEKIPETLSNDGSKDLARSQADSAPLGTIDSQFFEEVDADCVFPIGIACRPSAHLRDLNLRFQAAPLDWMTSYSLNAIAHLFETNFTDFFAEITEIHGEHGSSYRCVKDTKNDISSMHHFRKGVPLEEAQRQFRETMLNRADKVDKILKESSAIALICNRNKSSTEELIEFLNKFAAIYSGKKITLIDVNDANINDIKKEILPVNDTLKIIQYTFNDKSVSENSADSWKGNADIWTFIVKSIKLSDKFINTDTCPKLDF